MSIADLIQRGLPSYVIVTPWQHPVPPHKTTKPHHDTMPDKDLPYHSGVMELGMCDLPKDWEKKFIFTPVPEERHDRITIMRERYGNGVLEMVNLQTWTDPYLTNTFWQVLGQRARFCDVVIDVPNHNNGIQQFLDITNQKGLIPPTMRKNEKMRETLAGTEPAIEDLAYTLVTTLNQNHRRILEGRR